MAQVNLAGRDPDGHPRLYITHIPCSEVEQWKQKAQSEGWTDLQAGKVETESEAYACPASPISAAWSAAVRRRLLDGL